MSRRERKKEETRASIIACAAELFKEKGFMKTSVEEIAENADVSKATLYNYFEDKESILSAYFQTLIIDYGKEINTILKDNKGLEARLGNLLNFKYGVFGSNVELTAIYLRYRMRSLFDGNPFDNPHRSGLENVVLKIIAEAQQSGEIRSDMPLLTISRTFMLMTVNYFISSMYIKDQKEIDNLKNQLIALFLNGAKNQ